MALDDKHVVRCQRQRQDMTSFNREEADCIAIERVDEIMDMCVGGW